MPQDYWGQVARNLQRIGRGIPFLEAFVPDEETPRRRSAEEELLVGQGRGMLDYRKFADDLYRQQAAEIGARSAAMARNLAGSYAARGLASSGLSNLAQMQAALDRERALTKARLGSEQLGINRLMQGATLLQPTISRDERYRDWVARRMIEEREAGYEQLAEMLGTGTGGQGVAGIGKMLSDPMVMDQLGAMLGLVPVL